MGLFSFLSLGKKQIPQQAVIVNMQGAQATWMDQDGRTLADEGYQRNAPTFRCINLISKSLANIEIQAFIGDEEVPDHDIIKLLLRPNPLEGGTSFFYSVSAYNRIIGNSFVEAIRDGGGTPRELRVWTPYEMKVLRRSDTYLPVGYQWKDGKVTRMWDVDFVTGESDILHWKTFNPFSQIWGMSPMLAAAYSIDQYNSSSEWNQALLQNGASPDGMLVSKGKLTDAQYDKLRKELEDVLAGPKNAKRPFIADGDLKWEQIALTPKEMDWLNGRISNATDVAMVYGVPTQLLGLKGAQTFANFEQARLSLYQDTVIPLTEDLISEFNNWLVPMYKTEGLHLRLNKKRIPALQEVESKTMLTVDQITFLTINEKRKAAGFEPIDVEGADDIWLPSGLLPLGFELPSEATEEEAVKALVKAGKTEAEAKALVAKHWKRAVG